MKAQVFVKLKEGVLDPQGKAIQHAAESLGFEGVVSVRQGKVFDVEVDVSDEAKAKEVLGQLSEKLLANTVIEDFEVKVG